MSATIGDDEQEAVCPRACGREPREAPNLVFERHLPFRVVQETPRAPGLPSRMTQEKHTTVEKVSC